MLIVPVLKEKRSDAVSLLQRAQIVALSPRAAAQFAPPDMLAENNTISATHLVATEQARLEERRRRQFEEHQGGWSLADQNRLDELIAKYRNQELRSYKPFLVRAVAKNEGTGGFVASMCGDTLSVDHVSLGHSIPLSVRLPVIVFLKTRPTAVFVRWHMAG